MWSITNRRRRRPRRRHKGAIFMVTSFLWMNPFPFFEKKKLLSVWIDNYEHSVAKADHYCIS